ncbi:MAG: hypothetical protein GY820_47125, partial [Gammaproteobacteria bacterium]|nr:hypothetical protein [Gammaproteobacteria bacterium]
GLIGGFTVNACCTRARGSERRRSISAMQSETVFYYSGGGQSHLSSLVALLPLLPGFVPICI